MAKKKKKCLILYVNDPVGGGGYSAEEEYERFENYLRKFLTKKQNADITVTNANHLEETPIFDILVLDYGGVSVAGAMGLGEMQIKQFVRLLEDNPSKVFFLVGWVLSYALRNEVKNTLGIEPEKVHNLFSAPNDKMEQIAKAVEHWLR